MGAMAFRSVTTGLAMWWRRTDPQSDQRGIATRVTQLSATQLGEATNICDSTSDGCRQVLGRYLRHRLVVNTVTLFGGDQAGGVIETFAYKPLEQYGVSVHVGGIVEVRIRPIDGVAAIPDGGR